MNTRKHHLSVQQLKTAFISFSIIFVMNCSRHVSTNNYCKIAGDVPVFVVNHGWHTGLIISKEKISSVMPELNSYFSQAVFLEFGWGDREFYQAVEFSMALAFKALFYPSRAVIHVTGLTASPEKLYDESTLVSVGISDANLEQVLYFIRSSFQTEHGKNFIALGPGLNRQSQFFKANGTYYLTNNCNSWVMNALVKAGFDEPVGPVITSTGVMERIRENCTVSKSMCYP